MCSLCRDLALFIRRDPRICSGRRRGPAARSCHAVRAETPSDVAAFKISLNFLLAGETATFAPLEMHAKHVCAQVFVIRWRSVEGFFFKWRTICGGKKEMTAAGVNYINSKLGN